MEIPSHVLKKHYTKVDIEEHILKYQLYGNLQRHKRYMQYEVNELSEYQSFLYNRAMNGLHVYKPEDVAKMNAGMKEWIVKNHNKTQRVLNIWKQEITNNLTNIIFDLAYPGKGVKATLIDTTRNFVDPNKKNRLSFKELGIKKADIIKKLISEKILPDNFYALKPKTYGS